MWARYHKYHQYFSGFWLIKTGFNFITCQPFSHCFCCRLAEYKGAVNNSYEMLDIWSWTRQIPRMKLFFELLITDNRCQSYFWTTRNEQNVHKGTSKLISEESFPWELTVVNAAQLWNLRTLLQKNKPEILVTRFHQDTLLVTYNHVINISSRS